MASGALAPAPVSIISLTRPVESRTATLRCDEENSSAKIFIGNAPFIFVQCFNPHSTKPRLGALDFGLWTLDFIEQSFRPLNHRDPIRPQVFLQPRRQNLLPRFEPIQIEVEERQPPAGINVDEGER